MLVLFILSYGAFYKDDWYKPLSGLRAYIMLFVFVTSSHHYDRAASSAFKCFQHLIEKVQSKTN